MKKLFLTLYLVTIAALAHGQGTIAFGNSALTRIQIPLPDGTLRNATAADGLVVGVFYGPAGSPCESLVQAPGLATIGNTAGVLVNAPSVFPLPGTEQGQVVSLQIRAWTPLLCGETDVRQVTLGPTAGSGTVIWQSAASTNPNRFTPLNFGNPHPPACCIPEPSTFAVGVLGGALLLFFRRKLDRKVTDEKTSS